MTRFGFLRTALLGLAILFVSSGALLAQGVNISVSGTPAPGRTITVTVSGASAAAISASINGVPLSPEAYGPRVERHGKIEQTITLPQGALSGSLDITVTTPTGVTTSSVPITGADG